MGGWIVKRLEDWLVGFSAAVSCRRPAACISLSASVHVLVLAGCLAVMCGAEALAAPSHDNLRARMLADLEAELPAGVRTIGFWYLENERAPSLDIDIFREDLEIAIIQSGRFQFVNREMFDRALQEMTFCSDVSCLVNPEFMQRFGQARGLDAVLYGQVLDASENYPDLKGRDYFVTVQLKAISTSTSSVIWSKEITGVNVGNIQARIGRLPDELSLTREESLAAEVSRLLAGSQGVRNAGVRSILFLQFDDLTNSLKAENMSDLYRALSNSVVQNTELKLLDRDNLQRMLEELQMVIDGLVDPGRRSEIGQLYGVDAFVFGRIREVEDQKLTCAVRVSHVETNVDLDAQVITATSRNPELKLLHLLLNAGPSEFDSDPRGAEVFLAHTGQAGGEEARIGLTPFRHQLGHGDYTVRFAMAGYGDVTRRVRSRYGQPQRIFADLGAVPCVLTITSEPEGASVSLDGQPIGVTPLLGHETTWGQHRITVEKPMYESVSEVVDLPAGEMERHYTLRPTFGSLAVRTEPVTRGWIRLDGERLPESSPTTVAPVGIGQRTVSVERCDCDGKSVTVTVPRGGEASVVIPLHPKTRGKAAVRSVLFPGLGQHYKNQHGRAWLYHVATIAGGAAAVYSHIQRESHIEDYDKARDLYRLAVAEEDINRHYTEMESAYDDYEKADRLRTISIAAVGAVWAVNIVDAILGWPLQCDDRPTPSLALMPGVDMSLLAAQSGQGDNVRVGVRIDF